MRAAVHSRRSFLLLPLASLGSLRASPATEPDAKIPADLVLQRFDVARGGEPLLVPVRVRGKDRLFLVDTGCTMTVFDVSLDLGLTRGTRKMRTPHGNTPTWIYDAPYASIGGMPLNAIGLKRPISQVLGMNLTVLREAMGTPVEGLLGMDFLGQHIIHIDFHMGTLLLLRSVPKSCCSTVPLFWEFGLEPEVQAEFGEGLKARFIIDTGLDSLVTGSLETRDLERGIARGEYQELESIGTLTFSGVKDVKQFRGRRLGLGGVVIDRPRFLETVGKNRLGLGFLSSFVVTMDFPARRVYLCKERS